ncbi:hypothetical protein C8A01DRAFT_18410, partial [Parachaetomium inaequale]
MIPQAAAGAAHSPCRLIPPCKQGNHGLHITPNGERAIKIIGKYYFTEDALEHDLAALQRGAVYGRDEFFKRAKAWYKAEIDRLLHLERVRESQTLPAADAAEPSPASEAPTTAIENATPIPSRVAVVRSQTPTRIQPARAAKRRAAAPPSTKRPPRRTKTAPAPNPAPIQRRGPQPAGPKRTSTGDETRGDYALAAYDWAQFLNGNRGEHDVSPWSYVQLQGLDVAYFCMRLERAAGEKIEEVLARDVLQVGAQAEGAAEDGDADRASARAEEQQPQARKTEKNPYTELQIQIRHTPNPRCALLSHSRPSSNPKPPAPFQPAAALAPGEDWRPPTITTTPPTSTTTGPHLKGTATTSKLRVIDNITSVNREPTPTTSWAADEVSRREEMNRKQREQQAPEADMEISPTLGRWRRPSSGLGTSVGLGGGMEEDLGA